MVQPAETKDDEIDVRLCTSSERDEQARLYAACFKKPLPEGGLPWRCDSGPAFSCLLGLSEMT